MRGTETSLAGGEDVTSGEDGETFFDGVNIYVSDGESKEMWTTGFPLRCCRRYLPSLTYPMLRWITLLKMGRTRLLS